MALDSDKTRLCSATELQPPPGHTHGSGTPAETEHGGDEGVNSGSGSGVDHLATRLAGWELYRSSAASHPVEGPSRGAARVSQVQK